MGGSLSLCLQLQSRMDIILLWRHAAPQRSRGRGEFAREFEPHRWEPSATAPATKVQSVTTRNYNIRLIWTYIIYTWLLYIILYFRHVCNLSMLWFLHHSFCRRGIFTLMFWGPFWSSSSRHQWSTVNQFHRCFVIWSGWSSCSRFKEVESERCQGATGTGCHIAWVHWVVTLRTVTSVLEQSRGGSSWLLTNFWSKAFLVSFCFWQGIGWLGQETLLRVMNSAKNMRHGTWRLGLHEVQGALILNFILVLNYCIEKIPLAKSMFIRQHVCMLALAAPDPGNSTSLACRLECVAPKKKIQDKPGW